MKFTLRLVSAIWLSVMLVIGAFAYLQIRDERERLVSDLQRRAVLIGEGLSDALEPAAARQSSAAVERILKKLGPAQRGIAVYDRFATLMAATPDVAGTLPPSLPEVTDTVSRNMQRAQAAAQQEAARRLSGESVWTEARLKQFVGQQLAGRLLVVVSNREPVSHVWRGSQIHAQAPASGLVTAMDPVMRACGG